MLNFYFLKCYFEDEGGVFVIGSQHKSSIKGDQRQFPLLIYRPRHMVGTLEVIVQEASKVKIILPNVSALKEALHKAKEWAKKVEQVQV